MEENKKKLGQEPAFPMDYSVDGFRMEFGMSKRFYAACVAMQGMLSHPHTSGSPKEIITGALVFADELLRQEEL